MKYLATTAHAVNYGDDTLAKVLKKVENLTIGVDYILYTVKNGSIVQIGKNGVSKWEYVNGQPILDEVIYCKKSDKFTYAVEDTTDQTILKNGFKTKLDAWKYLVQYEEGEVSEEKKELENAF